MVKEKPILSALVPLNTSVRLWPHVSHTLVHLWSHISLHFGTPLASCLSALWYISGLMSLTLWYISGLMSLCTLVHLWRHGSLHFGTSLTSCCC